MLSALSTAVLYFASISPSGQLGIAAASSVFGIAAVIEAGMGGGWCVFIVSSSISFFLLPDKSVLVLYICFLGFYPMLKSFAEKRKNRVLSWIIKLGVFNISLTLLIIFFSSLIFDNTSLFGRKYLLYLILNPVFVLFDIGVTKLCGLYISKISRNIPRR
jgi:hypothetical protein